MNMTRPSTIRRWRESEDTTAVTDRFLEAVDANRSHDCPNRSMFGTQYSLKIKVKEFEFAHPATEPSDSGQSKEIR